MSALVQEQIAHEQTKVELYKAQFQILDFMGRQSMEKISAMQGLISKEEAQAAFDASVDSHDTPSGATRQPDLYSGS